MLGAAHAGARAAAVQVAPTGLRWIGGCARRDLRDCWLAADLTDVKNALGIAVLVLSCLGMAAAAYWDRLPNDGPLPVAEAPQLPREPIATRSAAPMPMPTPKPKVDQPNPFQPEELSSAGVVAAAEGCEQAATESDPGLRSAQWLARYCACSVDALRKNKGKAALDLERHTPTWNQLARCKPHAMQLAHPDGRSPFNQSRFNTVYVTQLVRGCENRMATQGKGVAFRIRYCGCYVDALRAQGERPYVSPEATAKCEALAEGRTLRAESE